MSDGGAPPTVLRPKNKELLGAPLSLLIFIPARRDIFTVFTPARLRKKRGPSVFPFYFLLPPLPQIILLFGATPVKEWGGKGESGKDHSLPPSFKTWAEPKGWRKRGAGGKSFGWIKRRGTKIKCK